MVADHIDDEECSVEEPPRHPGVPLLAAVVAVVGFGLAGVVYAARSWLRRKGT